MKTFTFNGVNSTDFFLVNKIKRSLLPPISRDTRTLPHKHGEILYRSKLGVTEIDIDVTFFGASFSDLRNVVRNIASTYYTEEPKELFFSDEPTLYYNAILSGNTDFEQIVDMGQGTLTFVAFDPFAYRTTEQNIVVEGRKGVVANNGTFKVYPKVRVIPYGETSTITVTKSKTGDRIILQKPKGETFPSFRPIVVDTDKNFAFYEDTEESLMKFLHLDTKLFPLDVGDNEISVWGSTENLIPDTYIPEPYDNLISANFEHWTLDPNAIIEEDGTLVIQSDGSDWTFHDTMNLTPNKTYTIGAEEFTAEGVTDPYARIRVSINDQEGNTSGGTWLGNLVNGQDKQEFTVPEGASEIRFSVSSDKAGTTVRLKKPTVREKVTNFADWYGTSELTATKWEDGTKAVKMTMIDATSNPRMRFVTEFNNRGFLKGGVEYIFSYVIKATYPFSRLEFNSIIHYSEDGSTYDWLNSDPVYLSELTPYGKDTYIFETTFVPPHDGEFRISLGFGLGQERDIANGDSFEVGLVSVQPLEDAETRFLFTERFL